MTTRSTSYFWSQGTKGKAPTVALLKRGCPLEFASAPFGSSGCPNIHELPNCESPAMLINVDQPLYMYGMKVLLSRTLLK